MWGKAVALATMVFSFWYKVDSPTEQENEEG
jgi:hypothetical protein